MKCVRVSLIWQGKGKRAIETFSATDLRDCPVARLQPWLGISVMEFKKKVAEYRASSKPVVPGADATATAIPVDATAANNATDDEVRELLGPCPEEGTLGEAVEAADQVREQQSLLVTCSADSTLGEAVEAAAERHVHRLWVVDQEGLLAGVVSLTDLLRVVREAALDEDRDLHSIVSS